MALLDLIKQGEGEELDFKMTVNEPRKIAKSLVAFANTKGGKLLIGVKDNGRIKGVDPEEESHMMIWAAENFCKPIIKLDFEVEQEEGKKVLIVTVTESTNKPHFWLGDDNKWWAYIRVKDQCLLASKVMLDVMKYDRLEKPANINFGKAEKRLLQFLEKNDRITVKEFCKLSNISRVRANRILVNLVRMNVIKLLSHEKHDYYSL